MLLPQCALWTLLMHVRCAQVINPIAFTEEASALLDSIPGSERVEHVLLTSVSPEHWYYAPDWAGRFAGATVWTVPGGWGWSTKLRRTQFTVSLMDLMVHVDGARWAGKTREA